MLKISLILIHCTERMMKLNEYELTFEVSKKDSDEVYEKVAHIDLKEYQHSYEGRASRLGELYSRSELNPKIRPLKEQFIFENITKSMDENEELSSFIDPLVDEIDKYLIETKDR